MTAPAPKTDTFKHPKGSFERLTASNYPSWQNNMQRLLRSIHCWNITAGLEEQPEELKGPVSADIKYQNRKDIEKYNTRLEDGAAAIYNACSVSIRIHINKMFHCHGVGRDINVQCVLIKEMIIIVDHYTLAVRNRR
jgi:hypothetical protein